MPKPDESDLTPFYAVAGLADVIADMFRESVAARQRRAEERLAEIRDRRLERVEQARVNADELREFLSTLPEQFRALPETTRVRLAEIQRQTEELLAQAGDTYSSLAGRGKRVVDDRVGDVRTATRAARRTAEDNLDDAAEAVAPLVDQAQEAVTEVRRNVTGRAARARTRTSTPVTPTPATGAEPAAADEVTPESATRAARAAAARTGGTVPDATDVSPAQALAQEQAAAAKRAPAKRVPPATKAPAKTVPAPVKKAAPRTSPATPSVAQNGVAENTVAQNAVPSNDVPSNDVPSTDVPDAGLSEGPGTGS